MAAAAKHLSVQLMAPEQPFHATTATESVFAGSTRDRIEQISQDGSAKHRTLTQGTHQQITEHKPAKTTVPERGVKPEATVLLLYMCSIATLPCFMALFRVWFDNYTDRLYHSYTHSVTDWSISPFLEYLVQFCNTSASFHVRLLLPYLSWPQALLLSQATERTKAFLECWPGAYWQ